MKVTKNVGYATGPDRIQILTYQSQTLMDNYWLSKKERSQKYMQNVLI